MIEVLDGRRFRYWTELFSERRHGLKKMWGLFDDISHLSQQSNSLLDAFMYAVGFAEQYNLPFMFDGKGRLCISTPAITNTIDRHTMLFHTVLKEAAIARPSGSTDVNRPYVHVDPYTNEFMVGIYSSAVSTGSALRLATMLSLLTLDIPHGPITAVLTPQSEATTQNLHNLGLGSQCSAPDFIIDLNAWESGIIITGSVKPNPNYQPGSQETELTSIAFNTSTTLTDQLIVSWHRTTGGKITESSQFGDLLFQPLRDAYPDAEIVSIGPHVYRSGYTTEEVSVSSVNNLYETLIDAVSSFA